MRAYIEQNAARALTPTGGFLRGFAYSLNPYTGCAFGDGGGCPYCYVRALPVAQARPDAWGRWVIAKFNLPELLERELAALERSGKLAANGREACFSTQGSRIALWVVPLDEELQMARASARLLAVQRHSDQ